MANEQKKLSLATLGIHADDSVPKYPDIAPPLHTSTIYRYSKDPAKLQAACLVELPEEHVYSRFSIENTTRLETLLSPILNGHVITYSSGLAAFHSLLVFYNPKALAIGHAYHGNHDVADIQTRLTGMKQVALKAPQDILDSDEIGEGSLVHLETPLNPTGEASNIEAFAKAAHSKGALLSVDSTFAPPPLQDPFLQGADIVLHSGTKYIGGHSDLLCGILVVKDHTTAQKLRYERGLLGCVMGNLEGWLGIRSTRTLALRVERASKNATEIVRWIKGLLEGDGEESETVRKVVGRVRHASVQSEGAGEGGWLERQMPNGFGPVFVIETHTPDQARTLPSQLDLFHHATSLGGVESLIEWRAMSDAHCDKRILRVSIGCEDVEDLKEDLRGAFKKIAELVPVKKEDVVV